MYSTISNDLLITILTPNTTAEKSWQALETIFIDIKPTRALYLKQKLSTTKLDSFPNMSAYSQELKNLSDQLANVDAPVTNDRLVLQLIAGLNDNYENIATLLQQYTPLPEFYSTRSKLIFEETRKANQHSAATALTANNTGATPPPVITIVPVHVQSHGGERRDPDKQNQTWNRGYSDHYGHGRNASRGGRGRGCGRNFSSYNYGYHNFHPQPWMNWTSPPIPYPTLPTNFPPHHGTPAGIHGTSPSQTYVASDYSYTPTNIEQAMHTMTLNPDQQWYLDSGATNHMFNTTGNISNYVNNSMQNHIVVGNGF